MFLGENYGVNSYGGSANYAHRLFDGNFNASLSMYRQYERTRPARITLGFSTNENYSSIIRGWQVNGSFGYAQNVQTLLITYMNSYLQLTPAAPAGAGERFTSAQARARSRTGLTDQPGTASSSQSYNGNFGLWDPDHGHRQLLQSRADRRWRPERAW